MSLDSVDDESLNHLAKSDYEAIQEWKLAKLHDSMLPPILLTDSKDNSKTSQVQVHCDRI